MTLVTSRGSFHGPTYSTEVWGPMAPWMVLGGTLVKAIREAAGVGKT